MPVLSQYYFYDASLRYQSDYMLLYNQNFCIPSASEMIYIVSGGTLNSTHSLSWRCYCTAYTSFCCRCVPRITNIQDLSHDESDHAQCLCYERKSSFTNQFDDSVTIHTSIINKHLSNTTSPKWNINDILRGAIFWSLRQSAKCRDLQGRGAPDTVSQSNPSLCDKDGPDLTLQS